MNTLLRDRIRSALRQSEDGMTLTDLADELGVGYSQAHRTMQKMPDVYIDRWVRVALQGPFTAVWCAVQVPENCPKPLGKRHA